MSPTERLQAAHTDSRTLWFALMLNFVWINLSEVFRYFVFVRPMMQKALPTLPDVAPMSVPIFLIWGVWDTILVISVTLIALLALERFGSAPNTVFKVATGIWASIFVILWLGLWNMNLAPHDVLLVALPLAWLEMFVAVHLVAYAMRRAP
ncbi:hypothetical protein [Roseibium sp.]|uniref:hypothetical protein n=1 Tax=Roseibium sp. TaxID=1936156 RepID=UPI003B5129BB